MTSAARLAPALFAPVLFAVAASSSVAVAQGLPVTYVTQGAAIFTFAAPEGWTLRTGVDTSPDEMPEGVVPAPRVVSLMPEAGDGDMWVGLWSPPAIDGLDAAGAYLDALKTGVMDEAEVAETRDIAVGGLPGRLYLGEGARAGRPLSFSIATVDLGARVAVAAFIGDPGAREAHRDALAATLDSIAPAEAGR
ncbi:hypothetical protein [Rubrimonas cliftonensis]|uniref:Uncharacterized protein n=1 Tax=Rubrimonas cliftonensis TaxID=89524 RepID=A0A1H4BYP0_9RHOB|nr:hypothetical protein [Rubrimonas cliftonensis]SEA53209.1 hypothetical protein SAMN05444370_106111 [Rubrimonas cliftonensis]